MYDRQFIAAAINAQGKTLAGALAVVTTKTGTTTTV